MVEITLERASKNTLKGLKRTRRVSKSDGSLVSSTLQTGGQAMWDIGCVAASIAFFAIAIGYAMGCDRLGAKEAKN
jgi:hypothetical protein